MNMLTKNQNSGEFKMRNILRLILLGVLIGFSQVLPQTTGKISGYAKDANTGEPLIGVNIILEGTNYGAATNIDGFYAILNLPPGRYNLAASYIGYTAQKVVDIRVNIDQTTSIDINLSTEDVAMDEIVIVAEEPVVQQDVASSRANISSEEIEALPTTDANRVIALQAGITYGDDGPVIRGGTARQTAYVINGITMRDERDNTPYTAISMTSVEDIQVQTGGFNAEHGNIRSGLVNVVTREGDVNKYSVRFIGRYRPASPKHFGDPAHSLNSYFLRSYTDDAVCWTGTQNGAWDEWTQNQYQDFEGWNAVALASLQDDDPTNDLTPAAAQELFLWQHRRDLDIEDPDYEMDMSVSGPVPYLSRFGNLRFLASYRGNREMYVIPLSKDYYADFSTSFKVTGDIMPGMKLMGEFLYGEQSGTNNNNSGLTGIFRSTSGIAGVMDRVSYTDTRMFATDYWAPTLVKRNNIGFKLTHALSERSFYEFIVSRFASDYSTNPGRNRDLDSNYLFGSSFYTDEAPFGFMPNPSNGIASGMRSGVGMSNSRDSSFVAVYRAKFDYTSQLDKYNQIKTGFEMTYTDNRTNYASYDSYLKDGNTQSKWESTPVYGGLYVQDKLEFEGMIANVGLRVDYLDPGGEWYVYDTYTSAFMAKDATAPGLDSLLPKEATEKQLTISPRLGIAFPISVNSKLFFNYGHQRSIPTPENLYMVRQSGTRSVERIANPNNPLEKTIQYELGYEHNIYDMFLLRLAGYYKDVTQQPLTVRYTNRSNDVNYLISEPNSYADIRGFEFTLSKNRGMWVRGFVNYTYQVSTSGRFGFSRYYENPGQQRNYEREETDAYQSKPVPRPYARVNLNIFTPEEFGPEYEGFYPLGDWNLNILGSWSNGYYLTYTGRGSIPGISNNFQWNDSWGLDLRISKDFNIYGVNLELFADISNALNLKYMTQYGFYDGNDYYDYMESLHLPEDKLNELGAGIANIPGDDKPGDYRIRGDYVPMIKANTETMQVAQIKESAIYWDTGSRTYKQFVNGSWEKVDQGKVDEILDNKQYINMPNMEFLNFLNPRDIYWGVKLSFELF